MIGEDARPVKRARTWLAERSFTVPTTLSPGIRVEVFHRPQAAAMGWYAAEVSSVDAVAKMLQVRYVNCSPGKSVDWFSYRNNHDLAFLPSPKADDTANLAATAAHVPAVSVSLGTRPSESEATAQLGRAAQMMSSMAASDSPVGVPAAACEPAAAASTSAVTSVPTAVVPAAAAPSESASFCVEEISLLDSDEEDGVVTTRTIAAPAVSAAVTLVASDSDCSDDDHEGDDGDVLVKGASASDYPHARCNCTLRRFHTGKFRSPATDKQNATTCRNCYCLVCDVLSSECSRWEDPVQRDSPEYSADGATLTIANTSHCLASDKVEKWVRTRQAGKHDWLKESPLYTHLGAQCYGAGADYFAAVLGAFECFKHPQSVPVEAATRYNSIKKVESALLKSLAHCTALSLQRRPCSSNACKKGDRALSSSQHDAQKEESHYDYGGYRFKVLPQQHSSGIAIAIADVLATVAARFTWRPATRIASAAQIETNREAYRRMVGKIDTVWTKALLSNGVSDATRAVARKRLAGLKAKAIEQQAWSLRAASQAAANGWVHTTGKTEHRRLVAAKIEHLCASRQWVDVLDYAAKADPSQLPGLLVKSGQVFKGVDSLISRPSPPPSYGWPYQDRTNKAAEEPTAADRNRVLHRAPEEVSEQVKRLQAAPGCDLGAAVALAGLPELRQMPHCSMLLALCSISATPQLPHLNSSAFTKLYQKMAHLAIVSILKGGDDTMPDVGDAGDAGDAVAGVSKKSLLSSAEQARRRRKGKDSAETVWFEKLATEIVSDDGDLPPIGLGSGCSNRFRELIRTLRRELAADSQGLSTNDSKQQKYKTDDHLQWCGEMAIELVVAACLRALWQPMLCADRGDVEGHLDARGPGGKLGDSQLRGAVCQLPVATPAATFSAAPPDTMNCTPHLPTEDDMFWSTLIDLDDGKIDPATSAQRHRQQPTEPARFSVIPKSSAWSSDPWHTGMSPGQQNTYPRGQFPALMAAPLAALRSLAETAMECGDPRSSVHLLKPLLWTCADLGAAAVGACCEKAAPRGSLAEETKTELKRCIHFVLCDLLPQVGPAAFSREAMLPPYYASWSRSDLVSEGRAIWPPAPKPHKDDNGNIRVHIPWPTFAKREWRHFITLRSLGILSSQLLQEAAAKSESAMAAAMESAPAAHIERWADDRTSIANLSVINPMHAAATRNTEASEQYFATEAFLLSATDANIRIHLAPELAVLRKIVPKSNCVPSSFSTARPGVSGGGSHLSAACAQLVEYLGDTCVMLLIDRCKANAEHNADPKTGRNERIIMELDLARRISFSYFYTKPAPQSVQLLQALWAVADVLDQRPTAMTWEAMQQRLAQQLARYCLPSQHVQVLPQGTMSFLEDHTYCDRLSALVCLNAWGPIRDIALAWWRQGNSLGERLLQPIDCGSATLYILVGQAPEEVLQSVRGRTAGTERDASRNPPFCKLEPVPDPATGTTQSVTTSDQSRKQRYTSIALGDAALVNICIHSVVPFCIAVLHAVQLTDTMPITSAGVFDGLMRWALRLRPISTGLHLNSLREKQQCVVTALDEATDRIAEGAVSGKVSVGRREVMIAWLRLACGWTIAAAEGRGECAVEAEMAFRNTQLVSFTQTVKKKAPLVKAIKAEFSQPLH